jgi:peptidoglycan/LPS O-acetylase OafA/YrhL
MNQATTLRISWLRRMRRLVPLAAVFTAIATPLSAAAASSCHLNSARGEIQHVIYIQFDNTHLRRDNPNVPADLE